MTITFNSFMTHDFIAIREYNHLPLVLRNFDPDLPPLASQVTHLDKERM